MVSYSYDSFGNLLSETGSISLGNGKRLSRENPFRYASYFYDEESGLYYVKARYYNPETGRFLTYDPVSNKNLYQYVENDPVGLIDPSGMAAETPFDLGFAIYDIGNFIANPSWANAGYALWSTASIIFPGVPGSYISKGDEALDLLNAGKSAKELRNLPGTASGSITKNPKNMMRGTNGNIGIIPEEVASQLRGKTYNNFDSFREDFWRATANSSYSNEFSPQNISRMEKGLAPYVTKNQQYGSQKSYVLHHKTPIHDGGGVYDLNNILIVTPKMHQDILSKNYHFGK